nr:hypothetical protein Iba_chr04aCG2450 [Ipomoea batatas]
MMILKLCLFLVLMLLGCMPMEDALPRVDMFRPILEPRIMQLSCLMQTWMPL